MPDPRSHPDTGTPRWVKVFAIIAVLVVLLFVVLVVTGRGGGHGPGRHLGVQLPATPPGE
jgi:ABC-type transporter Mla subunit MlaD